MAGLVRTGTGGGLARPGRREAAHGRDNAQRRGAERPECGPTHSVYGVLVLALDALLAVPGELRCVPHGALDNGGLEAARCRWRDAVLGHDPVESGHCLPGLFDAP